MCYAVLKLHLETILLSKKRIVVQDCEKKIVVHVKLLAFCSFEDITHLVGEPLRVQLSEP